MYCLYNLGQFNNQEGLFYCPFSADLFPFYLVHTHHFDGCFFDSTKWRLKNDRINRLVKIAAETTPENKRTANPSVRKGYGKRIFIQRNRRVLRICRSIIFFLKISQISRSRMQKGILGTRCTRFFALNENDELESKPKAPAIQYKQLKR